MHRRKGEITNDNDNLEDENKKHSNGFINIYFHKKGMEMINILGILRDKSVESCSTISWSPHGLLLIH